ncbi:hypothetical protein M427DRAFT_75617 [Gonapodya prolifera JEL478]|uniref:AraC effector-binding domain-containing protein n=1 Tax=Gonapodya prolifera (strain JEL478) TaxID=1344416 RepID=A0A138ZXV8_GONPJ|nr:hypothetical protein M427DRAFT_75617 [Gonapodya prolifera JEL478]|eukprot:KXS09340.1 hypothetical protein M427DRAFT_75617 [Gonapodya prolifera JEL478]
MEELPQATTGLRTGHHPSFLRASHLVPPNLVLASIVLLKRPEKTQPAMTVSPEITVQTVQPQLLGAVLREVLVKDIPATYDPAMDQVRAFVASHEGIQAPDAREVLLYRHGTGRSAPMNVYFGIESTRSFDPDGEVTSVEIPAGSVATAVHKGPYKNLFDAHTKVIEWMKENGWTSAGWSWEVYEKQKEGAGEEELETGIFYLLKRAPV